METKNSWFSVEIVVASAAAEAIEFALNELDALGTEINHLGKKQTEILTVIGYFNQIIADKIVQKQIEEALRIYDFKSEAVKEINWREIENRDWLEEWKKHWQPTKTGKFIIAPTWSVIDSNENLEDSQQNQEIIIRIDPEMAFGTGTHETTRLCLRAIEENYTNGMSFLDVGTGTGILAIAVAKMKLKTHNSKSNLLDYEFGNQNPEKTKNLISDFESKTSPSISACDTDETSVNIAVKNAQLNEVAEKIDFYVGSINENTSDFDFVCANLTADVILPIFPVLAEKSRRKLVLSGILKQQENLITKKLGELQIENFKVQTDGEWISIVAEK